LKRAGVRRLLDVRLNNSSQLSGFAKAQDLPFFLDELAAAEYEHAPILAPTQDLLSAYRKEKKGWAWYENAFLDLMTARRIEEKLDRTAFEQPTALLCSEATAEQCHRRLVLEYLARHWSDVRAVHL